MSCPHKFQNYLDLTNLDFEPTTLIVGAFHAAWPAGDNADWFYGRTANNCFWDVVPRLYGNTSLINATPHEWKQFCRDKQIAFTDLFSSIDDAEPDNPEHVKMLAGFSDKSIQYNFDDLSLVNIVQLLQQHPSIRNVYLTRGITEAFWRHLWNPVMQYCNLNGIHERRLLPPSDSVAYQHEAYNRDNPENKIPLLEDYILMRWQQEWHL